MSYLDWPTIDLYDEVVVLENVIHSQAMYLNVLFPNKYRYYFELVQDTQNPILLDHPFRLYFPHTILIEWVPPDGINGIYISLESSPEFMPFGPLNVQIYIPQVIYDAIVTAMMNPINSSADLVPPPEGNTYGEVEFVLLSTDAGEQIKIDLVNTSYVPEIPVTVKTFQWNEVLYYVMDLQPPSSLPLLPPPPSSLLPPPPSLLNFEFVYTVGGDLGITFIDPRYCFLREWITFPVDWTNAIRAFAGLSV
jgi:hypothetical protein